MCVCVCVCVCVEEREREREGEIVADVYVTVCQLSFGLSDHALFEKYRIVAYHVSGFPAISKLRTLLQRSSDDVK